MRKKISISQGGKLVAVFLFALLLTGCSLKADKSGKVLSAEEARKVAGDFINNIMLSNSADKAEIKDFQEESGLYKVTLSLGGKEYKSYVTKDGKTFFEIGYDIADETKKAGEEKKTEPATVSKKSDKPAVELFVMSHCPYGLQIEKGIVPAVEALGDKIDFKLKFCDYAMHGEKELNEELRQSCIQEKEGSKLLSYLKCFWQAGDAAKCLKEVKINEGEINKCITETDKTYKVMEGFNDKSTWQGDYPSFAVFKEDNTKYGVGGSPTLIINGEEAQSARDSASLLSAICSAFNQAPEECKKELSSSSPSAGFGEGTGGSAEGGCGN